MRTLWYLLVVVLGAIFLMSAINAIQLLLFLGSLTGYGVGQLMGALVLAMLMFLLARKALAKARAA